MTSQIDISQITDADIVAWFRAKDAGGPNRWLGFGMEYSCGPFVATYRDPKSLNSFNAFGKTPEAAIQALQEKMNPAERARLLRAKARELMEEAQELDPAVIPHLRVMSS